MLRPVCLTCVIFGLALKDVTGLTTFGRPVRVGGPVECGSGMFRCDITNCIRNSYRCDGDRDCLDGTDELDCDVSLGGPVQCGSGMFRCNDTNCIKNSWRCDGDRDCLDGSDELDCDGSESTTTSHGDTPDTLTVSETTTSTADDTQVTLTDPTPATTPATTICIKSIPEDSHISTLLSPTNHTSDSVNALTDGRYYLFHFELNWFQAIELCHQIGLRAATFNSELDYNQLTALIRQKNGYDLEASYWTAGSDLGKRGKWVWHPLGRPLMYTQWGRGEPSNSESDNPVERCLEIKGAKGYTMNDCPCDIKYNVICENNV